MKILLLYGGIGTLFVSCNLEEEYTSKKKYQEKMKIAHVKFNELLKDNKFSNAYGKVQDKRSLMGKTVMEEQYNFTIADKPVKILESAEVITYTILINRTLKNSTFFENLVVEQFTNREIRANIIKYTPFQPNNVQSYFSAISFNGNRTITPILYNDEMFADPNAKFSMYCYSVCVLICHDLVAGDADYSHPHTPDSGCVNSNSTTIDCTVTCWDTGGDGDGAGSGPPLDTPGGGGGGPPGNNTPVGNPANNCGNCNVPIYTAPVLEEEDEEVTPPCITLNKLFKKPKPDIKKTITDDLRPNIAVNPKGEKAAFIGKMADGTEGTIVGPASDENQVPIRTGTSYYSAIHTHPDNCYPMFTFGDVLVLNKLKNELQPHNKGLASFLLVCKDNDGVFQTYAIVFDATIANLGMDHLDDILDTPEYSGCGIEDIGNLIDKQLSIEYAAEENSEKVFLKFMKHSNVSLYKANSDLTNWNKLSVSKLNDTIQSSPCK